MKSTRSSIFFSLLFLCFTLIFNVAYGTSEIFRTNHFIYEVPDGWIFSSGTSANFHYAQRERSLAGGYLTVLEYDQTKYGVLQYKSIINSYEELADGFINDDGYIGGMLFREITLDGKPAYFYEFEMTLGGEKAQVAGIALYDEGFMVILLYATDSINRAITNETLMKIGATLRLKKNEIAVLNQNSLTLRELFPCKAIAKQVRDACGMVSIDQVPTAEQLSRVAEITSFKVDEPIDDLTGISHLPNLQYLNLYDKNICNSISELPAEFYTLENICSINISGTSVEKFSDALCSMVSIRSLTLWNSKLQSLPDEIGNLSNLDYLNIMYTQIDKLPDSICKCINLKRLLCKGSNLSSLPENIGYLTALRELDISDTKIKSLPFSIYDLQLETFEKSGLPIE